MMKWNFVEPGGSRWVLFTKTLAQMPFLALENIFYSLQVFILNKMYIISYNI